MSPVRPGQNVVEHGGRSMSIDQWRSSMGLPLLPHPQPRLPGGWRGLLLLWLPAPRSSIEVWDDEDTAEVTFTPTKICILLGDRPYVRYFGRAEDGTWFDRETAEVPNRWMRERLEAAWLASKISDPPSFRPRETR